MVENKQEINVNGIYYHNILEYSGYFEYQYAHVYVNNHDSITVKVFVKFDELTNLSLSDVDKDNGCWYFDLEPGQTIIKRLNPITPFEIVNIKKWDIQYFIVNPSKPTDHILIELMNPEMLSSQELIDIGKSRGKMKTYYGEDKAEYITTHFYYFDNFHIFLISNPTTDYT